MVATSTINTRPLVPDQPTVVTATRSALGASATCAAWAGNGALARTRPSARSMRSIVDGSSGSDAKRVTSPTPWSMGVNHMTPTSVVEAGDRNGFGRAGFEIDPHRVHAGFERGGVEVPAVRAERHLTGAVVRRSHVPQKRRIGVERGLQRAGCRRARVTACGLQGEQQRDVAFGADEALRQRDQPGDVRCGGLAGRLALLHQRDRTGDHRDHQGDRGGDESRAAGVAGTCARAPSAATVAARLASTNSCSSAVYRPGSDSSRATAASSRAPR